MFSRWHPQLALRYLPIVQAIKKSGIHKPRILEVGPGSLGIGPYLNQPFTGVDIDFTGPKWPAMKQVKGQAEKLPFASDSFDIALSVDVLEHLPPESRAQTIDELFRVAKSLVILAIPIGKIAFHQDKHLDHAFRSKFGSRFPFLKEHLRYGLPEDSQVKSWIQKAAKKFSKKIVLFQSGNRNLALRRFLMHGWMTRNPFINFFFRKVLLVFLPILFLLDRHPPHYRQIFFVRIESPTA